MNTWKLIQDVLRTECVAKFADISWLISSPIIAMSKIMERRSSKILAAIAGSDRQISTHWRSISNMFMNQRRATHVVSAKSALNDHAIWSTMKRLFTPYKICTRVLSVRKLCKLHKFPANFFLKVNRFDFIFFLSRNQSNMLAHRKKQHPDQYVKPAYMRDAV